MRRVGGAIFIIFLGTVLFGCAESQKQPLNRDDVMNKWKNTAQNPPAPPPQASPQSRPSRSTGPGQESPKTALDESKEPARAQKPLPTQKVSLRMHNADTAIVLRALARAVDVNILLNDKVKGSVSVDIEAIPWDQAFQGILHSQGLNYKWEGELLRVLTVEDMENDYKIQSLKERQGVVESLVVRVVPVDYADIVKLQDKMKEQLSKDDKGTVRGSVAVDEHTNSLVINATQSDITKMIPLVDELDRPTPQIRIESTIVETTKETAHALGIQWGGLYTGGDVTVTPGGTKGVIDPTTGAVTYTALSGMTGISSQGFATNFPVDIATGGSGAALGLLIGTVGGNILDIQLSALQTDGKLNILSSPSITTLDNQLAFTENGEEVPFVSTVTSSSGTSTEVKFKDAVLRLEITPHVIAEDKLKMKIVVKKDEVDFTRTVQGNPVIVKKQTQTTLITRDGETIVISGLTKETNTTDNKGIPGLQDTPLLGWLFRSKSNDKKMEEVLIFITPRILRDQRIVQKQAIVNPFNAPLTPTIPVPPQLPVKKESSP